MTLALTTLRSRLADAELRAFTAERSAKRARSALRETRQDLSEALTDLSDARACASARGQVLFHVAAHQLGIDPSRRTLRNARAMAEVHALIDRWFEESSRRSARERAAAEDAHMQAMARALSPWMRGEDSDG